MKALRTAWWVALTVVLLLAPLPLGSENTEWSMLLAALVLILGAAGAVAGPWIRGERPKLPVELIPIAVFVAWCALQAVPLPPGLVGALSPERASLPPAPEGGALSTLSVYPGATVERAVLWLSIFYLGWAVSRGPTKNALRALAVVGFAHAVLAFVLAEVGGTAGGPGGTRVFWVYHHPETLTPYGTYYNKNHFAGLMVVCGSAALALLLSRWQSAIGRLSGMSLRAKLGALTGRRFFRLFVPAFAFLAMLLSVFASGSRGAGAAVAGALLVTPVLAGLMAGRVRLMPVMGAGALVLVAAVAAMAWSSTSVLERFLPQGRYMNRPRLWKDVTGMALRYPVAGTGLGTFPYVYPRYQSFEPEREFSHAESDWVQYLSETGAVGGLALLAFGFLVIRRLLKAMRANTSERGLLAGLMVGTGAIALHGFVDVAQHRPANMVAASVLLGAVLSVRVIREVKR